MTISDLNTETRFLCDADSNQYTAADLLRRINQAYEEVVGKIIGMDGRWQFDDSNFTDLPIGLTTLVNSQQDYSFDSSMLEIERVELLDSGGNWILLSPIDKSQIGMAMGEYQKDAGLPMEYDKQGSSIFLYPKPSSSLVTLTNGLKVYFKRTASIFTSAEVTTGTKQPGFASPYHIILAYKAALPYCMAYVQDRVPMIMKEIARLENELTEFYSRREQDVRKQIRPAGVTFR